MAAGYGVGGATGIAWVEARDTAKPPAAHRTAPVTRKDLDQSIGTPSEEACP